MCPYTGLEASCDRIKCTLLKTLANKKQHVKKQKDKV